MRFMESRLLGIQLDEPGHDAEGAKFALQLHGVERLLVNEVRQQNVVEEMMHWKRGESAVGLHEVAFALMTGVPEKDCAPQLAAAAREVVDRVTRGEIELMEISAGLRGTSPCFVRFDDGCPSGFLRRGCIAT